MPGTAGLRSKVEVSNLWTGAQDSRRARVKSLRQVRSLLFGHSKPASFTKWFWTKVGGTLGLHGDPMLEQGKEAVGCRNHPTRYLEPEVYTRRVPHGCLKIPGHGDEEVAKYVTPPHQHSPPPPLSCDPPEMKAPSSQPRPLRGTSSCSCWLGTNTCTAHTQQQKKQCSIAEADSAGPVTRQRQCTHTQQPRPKCSTGLPAPYFEPSGRGASTAAIQPR